MFLYEDIKSYCGREPCQGVGVIIQEHPRTRCNHVMKQVVKEVFFVDIRDIWVPIQIDLRAEKL